MSLGGLRVLHLAPFNRLLNDRSGLGLRHYNVPERLSNGFRRAGADVFEWSEKAALAAAPSIGRGRAYRARLGKLIEQFRPDLILACHLDATPAGWLGDAAARGKAKIALYTMDRLSQPKTQRRLAAMSGIADAVFATGAGSRLEAFSAPGRPAAWIPNPFDPGQDREAAPAEAVAFDLAFPVGSASSLRQLGDQAHTALDLLAAAQRAAPTLRLWAPGLTRPKSSGAAHLAVLRTCLVGFAFSQPEPDGVLYASDRLTHMLGAGLCVVQSAGMGFERIFSDDDTMFVSDPAHLTAATERALSDPNAARAMGLRSRAKAADVFDQRRVAAFIADVTTSGTVSGPLAYLDACP